MKPAPQQVEEDVLVGPCQRPPSKLEVPSHRDGLLEDLIVLGHVPVTEAIVWGMGLVHQDRRHQLFQRVSLFDIKRIHSWITLSVFGYDVPVWSVTLLQGGREMYSPLGVI